MADASVLRANERYKALATMHWTLGTALFAAGVVQGYQTTTLSIEVAGWLSSLSCLCGSGGKCWVCWKRRTDMIVLPPVIAELFPAIMGLVVAAAGWAAAMYTKRHAHARKDD